MSLRRIFIERPATARSFFERNTIEMCNNYAIFYLHACTRHNFTFGNHDVRFSPDSIFDEWSSGTKNPIIWSLIIGMLPCDIDVMLKMLNAHGMLYEFNTFIYLSSFYTMLSLRLKALMSHLTWNISAELCTVKPGKFLWFKAQQKYSAHENSPVNNVQVNYWSMLWHRYRIYPPMLM